MSGVKFRAWDKNKQNMLNNVIPFFNQHTNELDYLVTDYHPSGYGMTELELEYDGFLAYEDDENMPYEVMQYTGLKDKNGVEIFEGDIIGNPNNKEKDNWYVSHHVVEWFDTGFMGKQLRSSSRIGLEYWTRGENGYVVIGNIHENPELLGRGKLNGK